MRGRRRDLHHDVPEFFHSLLRKERNVEHVTRWTRTEKITTRRSTCTSSRNRFVVRTALGILSSRERIFLWFGAAGRRIDQKRKKRSHHSFTSMIHTIYFPRSLSRTVAVALLLFLVTEAFFVGVVAYDHSFFACDDLISCLHWNMRQ